MLKPLLEAQIKSLVWKMTSLLKSYLFICQYVTQWNQINIGKHEHIFYWKVRIWDPIQYYKFNCIYIWYRSPVDIDHQRIFDLDI